MFAILRSSCSSAVRERLARLRLQGELAEFGQGQLRFGRQELRALLSRQSPDADDDSAARVRGEGRHHPASSTGTEGQLAGRIPPAERLTTRAQPRK